MTFDPTSEAASLDLKGLSWDSGFRGSGIHLLKFRIPDYNRGMRLGLALTGSGRYTGRDTSTMF